MTRGRVLEDVAAMLAKGGEAVGDINVHTRQASNMHDTPAFRSLTRLQREALGWSERRLYALVVTGIMFAWNWCSGFSGLLK